MTLTDSGLVMLRAALGYLAALDADHDQLEIEDAGHGLQLDRLDEAIESATAAAQASGIDLETVAPDHPCWILAAAKDASRHAELIELRARHRYLASGITDQWFLRNLRHLRRTSSVHVALQFATDEHSVLLLGGPTSTGKSIASYLALAHLQGRFVRATDLTRASLWADLAPLIEPPVLVIDDVWRAGETSTTITHLLDIIDQRTSAGRKTLLTCNQTLKQFRQQAPAQLQARIEGNSRPLTESFFGGDNLRLNPAPSHLPLLEVSDWAGAASELGLFAAPPTCHLDRRTWSVLRRDCRACSFRAQCAAVYQEHNS